MPSRRPTPFDLVFGDSAEPGFSAIAPALSRTGTDPRDRDAFLMLREVVTLVRELRPEEGLGEGIDQLAALVHHSYLFWAAGRPTVELPGELLAELLGSNPPKPAATDEPLTCYVQVPERRIWAETIAGTPPEPLDGCFVHQLPDGRLRTLGIFGLQPGRAGFTVIEVAGVRPIRLARADGSPLFSPTLPGGAAARLFSLVGGEELLELGWRVRELGAWSWEPRDTDLDLGLRSSQLPAPSS